METGGSVHARLAGFFALFDDHLTKKIQYQKIHLGYVLLTEHENYLVFGLLAFVLAATASAAEIPSLVGSWAGAGPGYNAAAGYIDEGCTAT